MKEKLALDGGVPVRKEFLPYSRPVLTPEEEAAALDVLKSGWLTTGPTIGRFEEAFSRATGAAHAVAVSSCTAALHLAYAAVPTTAGDEVVVPALTFAATAAAAVMTGARPVIADVGDDLNLSAVEAERRLTPRTRAIAVVHMGGLPADLDGLETLAAARNVALVQDCAHAVGTRYDDRPVGGRGFAACYSFHAVKQISAGEGGTLTTDRETVAARARLMRSHFQTTSAGTRHGRQASYRYDIVGAGYNYRLPEINAALALSQLGHLAADDARRQELAAYYDRAFAARGELELIPVPPGARHGRHLYIVKLRLDTLKESRDEVFRALRAENIGVNVHYIPLHYHTYYRETFGYRPGDFPNAERLFERIISLPLFAAMTEGDAADVVAAVNKVLDHYKR